MKLNVKTQIFIAFASVLTFLSPTVIEAQTKQLSESNKSQIIAAILRKENFKDSELSGDDTEKTIHLLAENISAKQVLQIKGKKFVFITQPQVDEMKKNGVEYYSFGEFEVRKSSVRVYFGRDYIDFSSRQSNGSTVEYICRKVAGKWKVKGRLDSAYAS